MNDHSTRNGIATGSDDAAQWNDTRNKPALRPEKASPFTARLSIDVTPMQRSRIKLAAFQRGMTAGDMLRALLAREFPDLGEPS
jgi:hypothetical protein